MRNEHRTVTRVRREGLREQRRSRSVREAKSLEWARGGGQRRDSGSETDSRQVDTKRWKQTLHLTADIDDERRGAAGEGDG